ncbi:MAG: 2'-deoxycytidine 5'-triphosphate deaminase [Alphaproteobacteria bacterium]|nr:2'-deoxycytidine 5'-triphosphate deaminase [Alphaproteobacteria bacterium]
MAEAARPLFPDLPETLPDPGTGEQPRTTGILPFQAIRELVRTGEIAADQAIGEDQVQPASLDLRLGVEAFRAPASFLPGPDATVRDKIASFDMHRLDLTGGAVLERGCVYIVPLMERVALGAKLVAFANPKSSTGRLDIFVRLITDRGTAFDRVEPGYKGPLYAEIAPRTFSVLVRPGTRLNQLRLRRGTPQFSASALRKLQQREKLVHVEPGRETIKDDMIGVTLDLEGDTATGLIGYQARKHTGVIDVDRRAHYDPEEYWDPIRRRGTRGIVLNPDDFYILATKEAVTVPPDYAAEMVPYDTNVGEFRVHYAGFFDPGFGWGQAGQGSRAVLEVRSHEVPFVLEHEQVVGWLRYERLSAPPERLYGQELGSNYQRQGLRLGKQFR